MKTIVITGSTKGIGFGLAKEFLKRGHQVVINSRSKENLEKAKEKLTEYNDRLYGRYGDVSDHDFVEELFYKAVTKFGKVDIWINNAGIPNPYKKAWNQEYHQIKEVLDTNIYGTIIGTIVAFNHMNDQGFGKIFNFEGMGSNGRILDKLSIYGTSKRAVNYFTKAFSKEIKESNVQIGIINPGMVITDLLMNPMKNSEENEMNQFKKVVNYLAERIEVIAPWICNKILKSTRNYDRIKYPIARKIFKNLFVKTDYFKNE